MSRTKYSLTPEHRAQLEPWAQRWIENAMSTRPMDDADRAAMRIAIRGLYEAAGLTPPPDHRIVFVPSPFVGRFAGGFAAGVWHLRRLGRRHDDKFDDAAEATAGATADATFEATAGAMRDATRDATAGATYHAVAGATFEAVAGATYHAVSAAASDATTFGATFEATSAATYHAVDDATYAATGATRNATRAATADAMRNATLCAVDVATYVATYNATEVATHAGTHDATYGATYHAAELATHAAARDATAANTWWTGVNPHAMRRVAERFGPPDYLLACAKAALQMWQGGNQWSAWVALVSFFRHVAELPIDYTAWQHWESAAIHGGPRIMHSEFCMVSDRPELLTVDEQNRPHNDSGPFCRWRDGTALYAIHGVRVPAQVVEAPHTLTVQQIQAEPNAEVRRIMVDRFGRERYIRESGATVVHRDEWGTLYRADMGDDEPLVMVEVVNSTPEPDGTYKDYMLRVEPSLRPMYADGTFGPPQEMTALNAVASTFGMTGDEYKRRLVAQS